MSNQSELNILKSEVGVEEGTEDLKDIIAPSAIKIAPYHIEIGNCFAKTFFIYTYPKYLHVGWFAPIVNMDLRFDAGIFVYPADSGKILNQLTKRTAQIQSSITDREEKGFVRDPMLETALENVESLRDKLQQGTERLFKVGVYITLYAINLKQLDKDSKQLETVLGSSLIYTKPAMFQEEQGFNSTLPLANDELFIVNSLNTSSLSTIFPFLSYELSSDEGILYGINRHNNSLILFDRFTLENANTVIFGKSGGGKSYAVKLEILRSMMFDSDVIVIDPENEYEFLCDSAGGSFVRISLNSDKRINPFDLPRPLSGEDQADVLRSSIIDLKGLFRLILGSMSPEKDSLLDQALYETYSLKGVTQETDWSDKTMPTMQDFIKILESMEGMESEVISLKKYTEGTFAGIFNEQTNIELNNQLMVFSIRDLEDELRPIAMYAVLNYLWNIVRSAMKKRILIVDEAWWMMQYEDSAKFLYSIAKRCRKYYLGLTVISQDVEDFLNNSQGKAIVNNSSLQILLRQSPASIDLVQQVFHLTQEEKYVLLESDVGEGIFFAGNKHVAIRVVASYQEDQIITSDPKQLLDIQRAKEEFEESLETD